MSEYLLNIKIANDVSSVWLETSSCTIFLNLFSTKYFLYDILGLELKIIIWGKFILEKSSLLKPRNDFSQSFC